jgi:hypothetical protein
MYSPFRFLIRADRRRAYEVLIWLSACSVRCGEWRRTDWCNATTRPRGSVQWDDVPHLRAMSAAAASVCGRGELALRFFTVGHSFLFPL